MLDEQNGEQEALVPEEGQDSTPETVVPNEELTKAQELANNYKIRAEKAEKEAKKLKSQTEKETPKNDKKENYSLQDIRALQDVHDDDVQEITDYAKFKGISIAEAKKNPIIQNTLKTRAEERKTAEVTNTTTTRRGSSKASDESLLDQVSKGTLPEEDIDRAVKARIERMKKR